MRSLLLAGLLSLTACSQPSATDELTGDGFSDMTLDEDQRGEPSSDASNDVRMTEDVGLHDADVRDVSSPPWALTSVPMDARIVMTEQPGFFECIEYTVEVDAQGRVNFEASHSRSEMTVNETRMVSPEVILELFRQADAVGFLNVALDPAADDECGTDGDMTITLMRANGAENTVNRYGGCEGGIYDEMRGLEEQIRDSLVDPAWLNQLEAIECPV